VQMDLFYMLGLSYLAPFQQVNLNSGPQRHPVFILYNRKPDRANAEDLAVIILLYQILLVTATFWIAMITVAYCLLPVILWRGIVG